MVSGAGGAGAATHPGPASVALPAPIRAEIIAHARDGLPNEACGLVIGDAPAADGGRAIRWAPTRNRAASPFRYEIDPDDLLRLTIETDDADEVFWAIVHSHVASPARPSPTDVGLAFYPDALYLLVSLHPDESDPVTNDAGIRAWRIVDGAVHEVAISAG
ncbi:MAG TPA: M67 family metallopeptidase [Candidatus Limnocylindrales bacterium]|nr:M67 family metallopeptidase [Candidatus Limnocylindrales bacterium]